MVVLYFFIVQQSLNTWHTHVLANGTVVTHFHPLNREEGKPVQDHNHTAKEISFYHQVNFDYFIHSGVYQIVLQVFSFPQDHPLTDEIAHFKYTPQQPVNRGPPAFQSITG